MRIPATCFWLALVIAFISFAELGTCITVVHLKPDITNSWNGSCTSTHCPSNNPCGVNGLETLVNNEEVRCDIIFTPGEYSNGIHFRNMAFTSDSALVVEADFPLTFESNGPLSSFNDANMNRVTHDWNISATGEVLLAIVIAHPFRAQLRRQSHVIFANRIYLNDSMTEPPIALEGPGTSLNFRSVSYIASSNAPPIVSGNISEIRITGSDLKLTSLLDLSKNQPISSFTMDRSSVTFSAPSLFNATGFSAKMNLSRLIGSSSALGDLPTANSLAVLNSEISNVAFSVPPSTRFTFKNSTFSNCNVSIQTSTSSFPTNGIVDSKFNITSPGSMLSLVTVDNGTPIDIQRTSVYVDTGVVSRKPFRMAATTTNTSSLLTNMVWFSDAYPTRISNLTVTHLVGAVDDQTMPVVAPCGTNMTWYFGSISASSVFLDLRTLQTLVYTADDPTKGAIFVQNSATLPVMTAPQTVQVSWLSQQHVFIIGQWYPLVVNISETPEITFVSDSSLDQSQLTTETRLIGGALSFRLRPTFVTPSANICPEPPYPTGFYCVDGVLVAIGNLDAPELVFPPNSGVVLVGGNLTVSGPISFSGVGSTLAVTGCVDAKEVVIDLKEQKDPVKGLPSTSVLLVSQGEGCSTSLLNVQVSVKNPRSCKTVKVKVDEDQSNPSALSVFFEVSTAKCKTKWIILGTVLGAVVLILITLMIIFTVSSSARALVRPFSRRRKAEEESNTYYIPK